MGKINFVKGQRNNYQSDNSLNEMFGDGGEVAQKIKDKLAKGSFELPMEMIVYVPSTKDGNVIIPKGDFQARVKNVRAFLATKFGGFSSNPTDGGYMSNDNKGLIEEDVVKVTAFATKEALEENLSPLLKKIQYWCRAWSQESIGFEFEGDLFYISATSKFMGGGMTYRNGSKTWIVMAVTNNGLLLSERLNESITHEEVYNRYKKQGYEVVDSQVLHTTNSDVLDVFKDSVTEFVLEKYDKQIDWDLSILSYKIIDNKMIVGKCVVTTIDGNEYEISPNDLLNNQYAKGGMTYNGGGMTEDQDNRTMIMRQAKEVAHHVEELNEILSKQPDIDAWVVAKMQDVTTQLSEVTHYLDSRVGFRLGGDDIQKVQDSMLANGGLVQKKVDALYLKSKFINDHYNWELKLLEMLQDMSIEAYEIYQSLSDEQKESVLRELYEMDNDMGGDGDGELDTTKENLSILLADARKGKKYMQGGEIILGGGNMASVQDSIMARGAKLESDNIKDLQKKLDNLESQRSSWIGGSESRSVKKSPYDDQIATVFRQIQYLEKHGSDKFIFPKADELKSRYGGRDLEEKTATMFARLFSENVSYSKFVNSLQTPTQKEAFRKLQYSTYQNKWKVKPIISKSSDTLRFKRIFVDGGEIILGGGNMASVQDSIMARGAKLESDNIKDLQKKLDNLESQRSSWIGGSESRSVKKSPYDDQIATVFRQIQYLEKHGSDKFIFPKADELKSRYGGRDLEEKTATMFARLFSENVSYSKFVNSLQTPTQKEAFRKLQYSTYQNKWKVKPIISKSSDTLRFKKIFVDGGNISQDSIMANGAKLENYMSRSKKWMSTIKKFPNLNEEYPQLMNMSDEEIITFVNTYSYYDRMEEGIEEEFDDINDAIEYLVLINE